ncbi:MAG: hypothetical protein M0Z99_33935 [Betaproteobacteria bacterium]|nr:hypothetical protein [Betaproteobacteria bacterium]
MDEALRPLRGRVDWLQRGDDKPIEPPKAPTALEDAQDLVVVASRAGTIDRESPTWNGVARWAANQLIEARAALEFAEGDLAAELRSRCKTLRDLLTVTDRPSAPEKIPDEGPENPL